MQITPALDTEEKTWRGFPPLRIVPHENELIGIAVFPVELKVAPLECRKLAAS